MMEALKKLVVVNHTAQIGDHAVKHHERMTGSLAQFCRKMEGTERTFTIHGMAICMVDDTHRRVCFTNRAGNTRSAKQALNYYRRYFVEECGYTEVDA